MSTIPRIVFYTTIITTPYHNYGFYRPLLDLSKIPLANPCRGPGRSLNGRRHRNTQLALSLLHKERPLRELEPASKAFMERFCGWDSRLNLQGETGLFQRSVTANVVNPLISKNHIFPFGRAAL